MKVPDADVGARTTAAAALLEEIAAEWHPAVFATSFGVEDMVLLDLIAAHAPAIEVFTLDTGRLPEETYALMSAVREAYAVPIRIYFPEARAVERFVALNGPNAFYQSVVQRRECCHVRKVEPLTRALAGKKAWLTGLRREQSPGREKLAIRERDEANGLEKFNPLLDWANEEVWSYVRERGVPYNALHDRGYPSIGCAPRTRAVEPGADIRSGRWWWEESGSRECGLHVGGTE
jgi:phosphoadenosine phosphosulfate reductase